MAEEKRYYWLKLKEDFFRDKRIKKLRRIAGGDTYTIIYLKMQLLSIKNNGILVFEGVEDNFAEELALELDEDVDNVRVTISFLHANGMIDETEPDHFLMTETAKCIGSEGSSAARVRSHRERKALQCNTPVTNGNTEIEIDREIEQDTDNRGGQKADKCPPKEILSVFEHWNSKNIIKHREITEEIGKVIAKSLGKFTEEEIIKCIDRYAEVLASEYFWNYKWSLRDFLSRKNGISSFTDEGSIWASYQEFLQKPKGKSQPRLQEQSFDVADAFALARRNTYGD